MGLPFTAEQFFGVFADYNRAPQADHQTDFRPGETRAGEVQRDDDADRADGSRPEPASYADQCCVTRQRVELRRAAVC